jgi:hypothetical protein
MGSKIASLQAGFMSDLNKKLGLGPKAPKPKEEQKEEAAEEPKEKAPLTDARKGRARGPQRRAPAAVSPAPAASSASSEPTAKKPQLSFATTVTVWSVDPQTEGDVLVGEASPAIDEKPTASAVEESPAETQEKPTAPVVEAPKEDKPVITESRAIEEAEPAGAKPAVETKEEKAEEAEAEKEEPVATKTETLATSKCETILKDPKNSGPRCRLKCLVGMGIC